MTREPLPILTRAESEIMAVLWRRGGATVHEVLGELERPVAYNTALTLIRILEQKGYVRHETHPDGGRAHLYVPAVPASRARRSHVRDLVDRLFEGRPEDLAAGLLQDERLGRAQLEELRTQIDRALGDGASSAERRPQSKGRK
jgi:predicted transcriptional regulator